MASIGVVLGDGRLCGAGRVAASVVRSAAMTVAFCLASVSAGPPGRRTPWRWPGLARLPEPVLPLRRRLPALVPGHRRPDLAGARPAGARRLAGSPPAPRRRPRRSPTRARSSNRWRRHLRRLGAALPRAPGLGGRLAGALPLVALRFHLVSPIGVLLNIPLIPLTSMRAAASGLTAWASAVWTPLGRCHRPRTCLPAAHRGDRALGRRPALGARFVAGPPWAWVLAFYALLGWPGGLGLRDGPRPSRRRWWPAVPGGGVRLPGPGWLFARYGPPDPLEGEVLAVGHGLAVVLRRRKTARRSSTIAGGWATRTSAAGSSPRRSGPGASPRLDAVFLSHADQDHYNALPDLLDRFAIGEVVVPPGFASEANPARRLS